MSQQINLYDASLRRQREWVQASSLAITSVCLLVFCLAWAGYERFRLSHAQAEAALVGPQLQSLQTDVRNLGAQLTNRQPNAALQQELKTTQDTIATRTAVLDILRKGLGTDAPSYGEILRGFARQTMPGLWLTGFNVNSETDAIEIRGQTLDPGLLPEYINRLGTETAFKGRSFAALKVAAADKGPDKSQAAPQPGAIAVAADAPPQKPSANRNVHEFVLTPTGVLPPREATP